MYGVSAAGFDRVSGAVLRCACGAARKRPAQNGSAGDDSAARPSSCWRWPIRRARAAGAGPLQWDPALAAAARQHCLRMAAEGPIAHRYGGEPDLGGARRAGRRALQPDRGERGRWSSMPATIHDGWMHSPGHRANLLNPEVDRVGMAVVASRGVLYAVADYERAVQVLTHTAGGGARGGA